MAIGFVPGPAGGRRGGPARRICRRTSPHCEAPSADKMGISFTCGQCGERVSKFVNRRSYTKGVVIIQCPSCQSRHLIADHLGWYKDWTGTTMGTIEQLADRTGQKVLRIDPSAFTVQDVEGGTGDSS